MCVVVVEVNLSERSSPAPDSIQKVTHFLSFTDLRTFGTEVGQQSEPTGGSFFFLQMKTSNSFLFYYINNIHYTFFSVYLHF